MGLTRSDQGVMRLLVQVAIAASLMSSGALARAPVRTRGRRSRRRRSNPLAAAPPWFNSDHFDVLAKAARPTTNAQLTLMLPRMLEDRQMMTALVREGSWRGAMKDRLPTEVRS